VTDTNSTPTIAHGSFTSSSYQAGGPLSGEAVTFDGSTTWFGTGNGSVDGPQNFTLLAWFKTTASSPGPIISFADAVGPSTTNHHDRSLWIDTSGDLVAAVAPAANMKEAVGATAVNDGNWHLAAVTDSSTNGLTLYLDGSSQATNSSATGAQSYAGWWSVGGGKLSGWSNTPTLNGSGAAYFNGSLAGVAVIPSVLTGAQVSTLHGEASYSAYATAVAAYSPSHYWGLQDAAPTPSSGSTATLPGQETSVFSDLSSNANTATPYGGVTASTAGPLSAGGSATFDGSSGYLETASSATAPQTFTQLVWFKTAASGLTQLMVWMGDHQDPLAGAAQDRLVLVTGSGAVSAYVNNGSPQFITSSSTYNDGNWHLAATTLSSAGFKLYVDGSLQASNAAVTSAYTYGGSSWWGIGVGNSTSWYFKGSLAGVAILPSALSAASISSLYNSSSFASYSSTVIGDSPSYYWPLTSENPVFPDMSASADDATASGVVATGTAGPLSATGSVGFDGSTGILTTGGTAQTGPQTFTELAWVKTTSASGGPILAFADTTPPSSATKWDRFVWVDTSGYVVAGVYPGSYQTATSTSTVNDGAWHLVAATVSAAGLKVYVDGSLQATDASGTGAQSYSGYWSIGAGRMSAGWADSPAVNSHGVAYLNGSIAGAAVLPTALSAGQISAFYNVANFSAYSGMVLNDLPSEYWPLVAPANACSAAVATVAITIGATTTCLLPAEPSGTACPSVTTGGLPLSDVITAIANSATTLTPGTNSTFTVKVADNGTLPSVLSGTDVLIDATVTAQLDNWVVGAVYSSSQTQL
jgi:hypothetical protein